MIDYDLGYWGVGFIFQLRGSVFPKTLVWALPGTCLAVLLHTYMGSLDFGMEYDDMGIKVGISSYNIALSFLLVFRTQQAYARWWQGATHLQGMRGEWLNAFSSFLAFTTKDPARRGEIDRFQHMMVRFMSLLHGAALRQMTTSEEAEFPVIDMRGVDRRKLEFLTECPKGCEVVVVLQWIQRTLIDAMEDGLVSAPAPILSRAFQDLSKGMVNLASAQTISELPFPFPYAQMINATLVIHTVAMPVILSFLCTDTYWVGVLSLVTLTCFWSINFVAQEIENPFGDDANDLPLQEMQKSFNAVLATLMTRETQKVPTFDFERKFHRSLRTIGMRRSMTMDQICSDEYVELGTAELGSARSTMRSEDSGYEFRASTHKQGERSPGSYRRQTSTLSRQNSSSYRASSKRHSLFCAHHVGENDLLLPTASLPDDERGTAVPLSPRAVLFEGDLDGRPDVEGRGFGDVRALQCVGGPDGRSSTDNGAFGDLSPCTIGTHSPQQLLSFAGTSTPDRRVA